MLAKNTKLFITGCLLLSSLFCAAGLVSVSWYKKTTECYKNRPPLESFVLTIDPGKQKLLIEQSKMFADKNNFKFDVIFYTPSGQEFLIDMTRKDAELTVSNPSASDLGMFYVYFYNNNCIHPTSTSDIERLVNDLKRYFVEIPDVTITEEK